MNTPGSSEIWLSLAGNIDTQLIQKVFTAVPLCVGAVIKRVHLLIQSPGGTVGDGIVLHNYFKNLPVELVTYNGGSVFSAGVYPYLAGKVRKASHSASFMIHKTRATTAMPMTAYGLQGLIESLSLDDRRTEIILKQYVHLPPPKWESIQTADLYIGADEAVAMGLATEIGDFTPAPGQLVNIG